MPSAAELAWLIPVLPLFGAVVTGLGLISFNRTVNRLRKPVALLLITCVGASAVLSYAILAGQLAGPHRLNIYSSGRVLVTSPCPWVTSSIHWVR